jgi:hypothetical protein
MVTSDVQPFSTFLAGEKIEDMLFKVNFVAINIKGCLEWTEVIKVAIHLRKSQLAIVRKTCIDYIKNDLVCLACWTTCAQISVALVALTIRWIVPHIKVRHIAKFLGKL